MGLFRKKSIVNIVIEDYVIRMAETDDRGFQRELVLKEKPLPSGLIEEGQILNEPGFYAFMKDVVSEWGIRNRNVRFYVPESSVLMKPVEIPVGLKEQELIPYFQLEIGHSIHLPFEDPILDLIELPAGSEGSRKGLLFAAPEEDIRKYTEVFADVKLNPVAADVRALGNFRLMKQLNVVKPEKTYLICDWSLNALTISIYSGEVIDFMRYQTIETSLEDWEYRSTGRDYDFIGKDTLEGYREQLDDQVNELDRIMNFYRFSLYKGERAVDELILTGDNPYLPYLTDQVQQQYPLPATLVGKSLLSSFDPFLDSKHVSVLGLSLKGGE